MSRTVSKGVEQKEAELAAAESAQMGGAVGARKVLSRRTDDSFGGDVVGDDERDEPERAADAELRDVEVGRLQEAPEATLRDVVGHCDFH